MGTLRRFDELKAGFRFRLGEPTEGTFGRYYYDEIRNNMDELGYMLNEAQRVVCWLCYNANQTLIENTTFLPVLSNVTRYTLPEELMGIVSVFHRTYRQDYEVTRENLEQVKATTRSERFHYRYRHYEQRERVPRIAARGIVSSDSFDILEQDDLDTVRPNDICYNLTDDSQGLVEAVFPALNRIKIDNLSGGTTNRFQKGDVYQIDMKESTCDAIEMWPAVTRADNKQGYSGNPTYWQINKDEVVNSISASISSLPSGFEDDERVILTLSRDSDDEVVGEGAREGLTTGSNEFEFPDFVQIREDTRYDVVVTRPDSGDAEVDVDSIKVTVKTDPESLAIKHASYPKPMSKDSDYCEMPIFTHEAMYTYAHILALKKQSRNPVPDAGLMAELNKWVMDITKHLYARDERGPHYVTPALGGNRASGSPYPSNWGHYGVNIWDLI